MTVGEFRETIAGLKEQGMDEYDIAITLYTMFVGNAITLEEFERLLAVLGYSLTDEFKKMSPEEQKNQELEFEDDEEESKKESKEEPKKDSEDKKEDSKKEDSEDTDKEEKERARLKELFGK